MNTITILNRVVIDQPIMERLRVLSKSNLPRFIKTYIDFMEDNNCMYAGTHDLSHLTYYIDPDYMSETYLKDEEGSNCITYNIEAEGTNDIYTYKDYTINFENTEKIIKGSGSIEIVCCLMEVSDITKVIHVEESLMEESFRD